MRNMLVRFLSRAEKTETLTEDLLSAEKKVDLIKHVLQNTGKRIASSFHTTGVDHVNHDKRKKKMPEVMLQACMLDSSLTLSTLGDSSLGSILGSCSKIQETMGQDRLDFELEVEKQVLMPMYNVLENEIPNIVKLRKQLSKLTLDMDSARSRYQTAVRSAQQNPGSASSTTTKIDSLKDEVEEASMKVEQSRDSLASEMFSLISHEQEFSQLYIKLYKLQADYHRKMLQELESFIPDLENELSTFPNRAVYGCPLEEHLSVSKRQISLVIETCVCCLIDTALKEEGLFRIAGGASKLKKLKSAFDAGLPDIEEYDPHCVAGALKLYLRELPEPLLTFELYDEWMDAASIADHDAKLQTIWKVLQKLPESNLQNLRYLMKFLAKLMSYSEFNKMSSQNLAIVMSPNLIWVPRDENTLPLGMNMSVANIHGSLVDTLIMYSDYFFPDEIEFHITCSPINLVDSPTLSSVPGSMMSSQNNLSQLISNGDNHDENSVNNNSQNNGSSNVSPPSHSPKAHRPGKKPAPPAPGQKNKPLKAGQDNKSENDDPKNDSDSSLTSPESVTVVRDKSENSVAMQRHSFESMLNGENSTLGYSIFLKIFLWSCE